MAIKIKYLGLTHLESVWEDMKAHISSLPDQDEIWVTEHHPIFTTGLNKKDFELPTTDIPHIFIDRGGKITYHGPGQLIIYTLLNLSKKKISIRELVSILENVVIEFLQEESIEAYSEKMAPGVYIHKRKIASIGLRLKNKYVYHGLSFNVDMDLNPFTSINPCGYKNQEMTQLSDYKKGYNLKEVSKRIIDRIVEKLGKYEKANN